MKMKMKLKKKIRKNQPVAIRTLLMMETHIFFNSPPLVLFTVEIEFEEEEEEYSQLAYMAI